MHRGGAIIFCITMLHLEVCETCTRLPRAEKLEGLSVLAIRTPINGLKVEAKAARNACHCFDLAGKVVLSGQMTPRLGTTLARLIPAAMSEGGGSAPVVTQ